MSANAAKRMLPPKALLHQHLRSANLLAEAHGRARVPQAEIEKIKDEIKALEQAKKIVESVSGTRKATAKPTRAKRGAKKDMVMAVLTKKPQRMRDIAREAGLSTAEAASVLQSGTKLGTIKKGTAKGTYRQP